MADDLIKFKPLVVGAPRSGFALLCSVLIHFLPFVDSRPGVRQEVLSKLLKGIGDYISQAILKVFEAEGTSNDLLFNANFRYLVGGPKWIPRDRPEAACIRKYIGLRGKGDFTLITSHPREVLNLDEIIHSHTDPRLWLQHEGYREYTKYASVRNPVGILNSSVFSINALASEYIQKFIPPEDDNDRIRQELALYKLTDLDFFEGLVEFLAQYFDEFMGVYDRFITMRWEDLIERPAATITQLAEGGGVEITEDYARSIWLRLGHVNLTQAHKHNYRAGQGVVGGWKRWLTNHHLRMIEKSGFEKHMVALGYGGLDFLDEAAYTPFQKKVNSLIEAGRVYEYSLDSDLFTFAFNKSNLKSDKFQFKTYPWREHTRIERSCFGDEGLQERVWDCAEAACAEINSLVSEYLEGSQGLGGRKLAGFLLELRKRYQDSIGKSMGKRYEDAFSDAMEFARRRWDFGRGKWSLEGFAGRIRERLFGRPNGDAGGREPAGDGALPHLVASEHACNVVEYLGKFYALPHKLGPKDVHKDRVEGLPGVLVTSNLEEALAYARNFDVESKSSGRSALPYLAFFECRPEDCLVQLMELGVGEGAKVVLSPWDDFADALLHQAGSEWNFSVLDDARSGAAPTGIERVTKLGPADILLINEQDPERLSSALLGHVDEENIAILAPITVHYWKNRPLFLISIPKGGTHLLFRLVESLGYGPGIVHHGNPRPGHWYCIEHSNTHTSARDFFIDTVRREPFGNRHHPFPRTPCLFIYRNPLDIAVSEANYYGREDATVFYSYFKGLDFEQRLLRVIDDPKLLGSIRDRVNNFAAWFDFGNVIPISFEELVGSEGGGDDEVRNRLIWSLQLKLHIPGNPADLAKEIYDRASPTFHEGRIGSWREKFSPQALQVFFSLDQDFMKIAGYSEGEYRASDVGEALGRIRLLPSRADEFRHRALITGKNDFSDTPINVDWNFLGNNLVFFHGSYYALPLDEGPFDLTVLSPKELHKFPSASDLRTLKALLMLRAEVSSF